MTPTLLKYNRVRMGSFLVTLGLGSNIDDIEINIEILK